MGVLRVEEIDRMLDEQPSQRHPDSSSVSKHPEGNQAVGSDFAAVGSDLAALQMPLMGTEPATFTCQEAIDAIGAVHILISVKAHVMCRHQYSTVV